jgi:hypothetical protein
MDAAFAAGLPLEMLDGVGYVNFFAVDAGFYERAIEQFACGADERFTGEIFLVAGLLADEHELTVRGTFAENGLRAELPEIAVFAGFGGFAQFVEGGFGGDEVQLLGQNALGHARLFLGRN